MNKPRIIFIVGPTSSGKTQLALKLAQKSFSEIISCDSMQVYREVSIVNNKPSAKQLKEVKHHLVDVVSVEEEFDVNLFNKLATKAIENVLSQKKMPIVVGGSGMYMQVLLDGIFQSSGRNEELRNSLETQAKEFGNQYVYRQLKELDEQAAKEIHPNNLKKVIRAIEVCLEKKDKFSKAKKNRQGLWGRFPIFIFGLNPPRQQLYEKINQRVDEMFEQGLVKEIKSLQKFKLSQTAAKMIGVKEVLSCLNNQTTLAQAKTLMKTNTRRYAKRQMTWFRKDQRICWIDYDDGLSVDEVVKVILNKLN